MGKLKAYGVEHAKNVARRRAVDELKIRNRARVRATLVENRRVRVIDTEAVQRAAASLEGTAELLNEADPEMEASITFSVQELRHFVAYMRAIDELARDSERLADQLQTLTSTLATCVQERDTAQQAHERVLRLQRQNEARAERAAKAAAVEPPKSSRKPPDLWRTSWWDGS